MKELSQTALQILEARYLLKDENGVIIETPEQMFRRVAKAVAHGNVEREEEYFSMMSNLEFLPNSPTLMNAGTDHQQLSACFVLPVPDDMSGIFQAIHDSALIFKSGGGVGYDFSQLRPEGDIVRTTGGVASGPISFMKVFNQATEVIKQGGKRRGASMAILRIDHPDIEKFIVCKDKEGDLSNFNISAAVTDEFMKAAAEMQPFDLIHPRTKEVVRTVQANELLQQIAEHAWKNGEPGIVFIDTINNHNPIPELGDIAATNPCGEQPLHPYFSCVLGSINLVELSLYNSNSFPYVYKGIDEERLRKVVRAACNFLDDVVEISEFPLPQITEMAKKYRNIGLGIMGLADYLALNGLAYDSEKGIEEARRVMGLIHEMAKGWGIGRENKALTCIAPTGTISMIADVSAGCEPFFSVAYIKKGVLGGQELAQVSQAFQNRVLRFTQNKDALLERIAHDGGSIQNTYISQVEKPLFKTALEISPDAHIRMQAALQTCVDAAVSKTVNMPNTATIDDVKKAYTMAWLNNCKGITIYRSGSRQEEVISSTPSSPEVVADVDFIRTGPEKPFVRPDVMTGATSKVSTAFGTLWLVLNSHDGVPREVFCTVGKGGSDVSAITEGYGRLISLALQNGVDINDIIKQLQGIGGNGKTGFGKKKVLSLPDGIAKGIKKANSVVYWHDTTAADAIPVQSTIYDTVSLEQKENHNYDICPSCGAAALINEAGCERCAECGYSRC